MNKTKVLRILLTIMVLGASVYTAVDMYRYLFKKVPDYVSSYIWIDTGDFR